CEKLRQRPATRLAAAADPIGIDLRARQQIVDSADSGPGAEQAEVGTEQDETASRVLVLARSAAQSGLARLAAGILDAFALSERVVREGDLPFARQVREEPLVASPGLAICRVPERPQDRRAAPCSSRHIEVRRDVEPRP